MLWVVLPFKAFQALFEVGEFKADSVGDLQHVGVVARGYCEGEVGVGAARHLSRNADIVGHFNILPDGDDGCVDSGLLDGDVLRH